MNVIGNRTMKQLDRNDGKDAPSSLKKSHDNVKKEPITLPSQNTTYQVGTQGQSEFANYTQVDPGDVSKHEVGVQLDFKEESSAVASVAGNPNELLTHDANRSIDVTPPDLFSGLRRVSDANESPMSMQKRIKGVSKLFNIANDEVNAQLQAGRASDDSNDPVAASLRESNQNTKHDKEKPGYSYRQLKLAEYQQFLAHKQYYAEQRAQLKLPVTLHNISHKTLEKTEVTAEFGAYNSAEQSDDMTGIGKLAAQQHIEVVLRQNSSSRQGIAAAESVATARLVADDSGLLLLKKSRKNLVVSHDSSPPTSPFNRHKLIVGQSSLQSNSSPRESCPDLVALLPEPQSTLIGLEASPTRDFHKNVQRNVNLEQKKLNIESPRCLQIIAEGEPKASKQLSPRQKATAIARQERSAQQSKVAFIPASQKHHRLLSMPDAEAIGGHVDRYSNLASESATILKRQGSSMVNAAVVAGQKKDSSPQEKSMLEISKSGMVQIVEEDDGNLRQNALILSGSQHVNQPAVNAEASSIVLDTCVAASKLTSTDSSYEASDDCVLGRNVQPLGDTFGQPTLMATEVASPRGQPQMTSVTEPSMVSQPEKKKHSLPQKQTETLASSTGPLQSLQAIGLMKKPSEAKNDGKIRLQKSFKVTTPSACLALLQSSIEYVEDVKVSPRQKNATKSTVIRKRIAVNVNNKVGSAMNADLSNVTSAPSTHNANQPTASIPGTLLPTGATTSQDKFITVHDEVKRDIRLTEEEARDKFAKLESTGNWSRVTPASVEYYDSLDLEMIRDLIQPQTDELDIQRRHNQSLTQKRNFVVKNNMNTRNGLRQSPQPPEKLRLALHAKRASLVRPESKRSNQIAYFKNLGDCSKMDRHQLFRIEEGPSEHILSPLSRPMLNKQQSQLTSLAGNSRSARCLQSDPSVADPGRLTAQNSTNEQQVQKTAETVKKRDLNKAAGLLLSLIEGMEQEERRGMRQSSDDSKVVPQLQIIGKQEQVTNGPACDLKKLRSQAIQSLKVNQRGSAYVLDKNLSSQVVPSGDQLKIQLGQEMKLLNSAAPSSQGLFSLPGSERKGRNTQLGSIKALTSAIQPVVATTTSSPQRQQKPTKVEKKVLPVKQLRFSDDVYLSRGRLKPAPKPMQKPSKLKLIPNYLPVEHLHAPPRIVTQPSSLPTEVQVTIDGRVDKGHQAALAGSSQHQAEESATVEDEELVMRLNENIESKFGVDSHNADIRRQFATVDAGNIGFANGVQDAVDTPGGRSVEDLRRELHKKSKVDKSESLKVSSNNVVVGSIKVDKSHGSLGDTEGSEERRQVMSNIRSGLHAGKTGKSAVNCPAARLATTSGPAVLRITSLALNAAQAENSPTMDKQGQTSLQSSSMHKGPAPYEPMASRTHTTFEPHKRLDSFSRGEHESRRDTPRGLQTGRASAGSEDAAATPITAPSPDHAQLQPPRDGALTQIMIQDQNAGGLGAVPGIADLVESPPRALNLLMTQEGDTPTAESPTKQPASAARDLEAIYVIEDKARARYSNEVSNSHSSSGKKVKHSMRYTSDRKPGNRVIQTIASERRSLVSSHVGHNSDMNGIYGPRLPENNSHENEQTLHGIMSNDSRKDRSSPTRKNQEQQLATKLSHPKIVVGANQITQTGKAGVFGLGSQENQEKHGRSLYTLNKNVLSGATLSPRRVHPGAVKGPSLSKNRNMGSVTFANLSRAARKLPSGLEVENAAMALQVGKIQLSDRNFKNSTHKGSDGGENKLNRNASPLDTLVSVRSGPGSPHVATATKDVGTTEQVTTELISRAAGKSSPGSSHSLRKVSSPPRRQQNKYQQLVSVDTSPTRLDPSPHRRQEALVPKAPVIGTIDSEESLKNSFRELLNASPRLRQSLDLANKMDVQMKTNQSSSYALPFNMKQSELAAEELQALRQELITRYPLLRKPGERSQEKLKTIDYLVFKPRQSQRPMLNKKILPSSPLKTLEQTARRQRNRHAIHTFSRSINVSKVSDLAASFRQDFPVGGNDEWRKRLDAAMSNSQSSRMSDALRLKVSEMDMYTEGDKMAETNPFMLQTLREKCSSLEKINLSEMADQKDRRVASIQGYLQEELEFKAARRNRKAAPNFMCDETGSLMNPDRTSPELSVSVKLPPIKKHSRQLSHNIAVQGNRTFNQSALTTAIKDSKLMRQSVDMDPKFRQAKLQRRLDIERIIERMQDEV